MRRRDRVRGRLHQGGHADVALIFTGILVFLVVLGVGLWRLIG